MSTLLAIEAVVALVAYDLIETDIAKLGRRGADVYVALGSRIPNVANCLST